MSTTQPEPEPTITRREYSGKSHALLVLVPPAIGWLVSVLFVFIGPFTWWGNYLIVGAIWGMSKPVRWIFRSALKYITYEFRSPEFSWVTCVKEEIWQERAQWRREPLNMLSSCVVLTVLMAVGWPLCVWIGAMLFGQLDHG